MSERLFALTCRTICGLYGLFMIGWIFVVRPMEWPDAGNALTDIDCYGLLVAGVGFAFAIGLIRLPKRK
jgi:hypothetical protein